MAPANNYPDTQLERVWTPNEPTFNVLVQPAAADAVLHLALAMGPVGRAYTENLQRRPTPDRGDPIGRKRLPSNYTLESYLKAPAAAGTVPQVGVLLKKAMGVETITGGVSVVYSFATAITETSHSLWVLQDNFLRGGRGCKPNIVRIRLSGTDEGRLIVEGFVAGEVFAGITQLGTTVDGSVTTFNLTDPTQRRIQVGPAASDAIRLLIESEAVLASVVNYTTRDVTVARGQDGTSAAPHTAPLEITPRVPAVDPDADDGILPLFLGSFLMGGIAYDVRDIEVSIDNHLEPRIDEWAKEFMTGYRRAAKREVRVAFTAYGYQTVQNLKTNRNRRLVETLVIEAGDPTQAPNSRVVLNMPRVQIEEEDSDSGGVEYIHRFVATAFPTSGNDELTITFN